MHISLVAAYDAEAGDVAADDDRRHSQGYRSGWHGRPTHEPVAVCWFDADAFAAMPRQGTGSAAAFTRVEEVVGADGRPAFHVGGRKQSLQPKPMPRADRP